MASLRFFAVPPPSDLAFGAFTETPPWVLDDPAALPWRDGLEEERRRLAEMVPDLVAPSERMPRGAHAISVLGRMALGGARFLALDLGPLYADAVRPRALWKGRSFKRPFLDRLSLRLVVLFADLVPTYIKLGHLIS